MSRITTVAMMVVLLVPDATQVVAQEPAVARTPEAATPVQIYLACRHEDVRTSTSADPAIQAMGNLCRLRVPMPHPTYLPTSVREWGRPQLLPSAAVVRRLAKEVTERAIDTVSTEALFDKRTSYSPTALFAPDSVTLSHDAAEQLRRIARTFREVAQLHPEARLTVTGFADSSGATDANRRLAALRAAAARKVLVEAGVPFDRVILAPGEVVADERVATAEDRTSYRAVTVTGGVPVARLQEVAGIQSLTMLANSTDAPRNEVGQPLAALAANVLVDHAATQIATFLMESSGESVCAKKLNDLALADALPRTCRLFDDKFSGLYVPTLVSIVTAVRHDLHQFPAVLLDSVVLADEMLLEKVPAASVARSAVRLLGSLEQGVDPVLALNDIARQLDPSFTVLAEAAAILDRIALAQATLSALRLENAVMPDTLLLYGLRAVAVTRVESGDTKFVAPLGVPPGDLEAVLSLHEDIGRLREQLAMLRLVAPRSEQAREQVSAFLNLASTVASRWIVLGQLPELHERMVISSIDVLRLVHEQSYSAAASRLAEVMLLTREAACAPAEQCTIGDDAIGAYKVLRLVADIAEARGEKAVAGAMRNYLGTARSSRGKREGSRAGWAVNAYVGVGAGRETALGAVDGATGTGPAGHAGVRIPIGVEGHVPLGGLGAAVLFLSFVDLGNFTTISTADSADAAPATSFALLFSPGVFLGFAVPKTPFSVLGGWNWVGDGRQTLADEKYNIRRWSISATVDVPLFP